MTDHGRTTVLGAIVTTGGPIVAVVAKGRPTECERCGAKHKNGARISKRGLCVECGILAQAEAWHGMRNKTGPYYQRWKSNGGHLGAGHPESTRWPNRQGGSTSRG